MVPGPPRAPVAEPKSTLRTALRAARAALATGEHAPRSAAACAHVLALPELAAARTVALYAPILDELDVGPLAAALAARGHTLAYPRVHGRALVFHTAPPTQAGAFGVREPAAHSPSLALAELDVVIVPALGLDARGARLGYGQGFYDATLAAAPQALRVGVAFDCQVVPQIPEHAGDQRVDVIVTESGARPTRARPGRNP